MEPLSPLFSVPLFSVPLIGLLLFGLTLLWLELRHRLRPASPLLLDAGAFAVTRQGEALVVEGMPAWRFLCLRSTSSPCCSVAPTFPW